MRVNFNVTKEESAIIDRIVKRAVDTLGKKYLSDIMSISMDITACHCNGTTLNLRKLLEADDYNFLHDVCGIMRNINRRTGKIENFFSPRCEL